MNNFHGQLVAFVDALQALMNEHQRVNFPTLPATKIDVGGGRKYLKVTRDGGSVYCFIDTRNGDILKAASWAGTAKHARGNIFADDLGISCCGPYGVAYLR